jgi:phage nucleotide-binding protein
MNAGQMTKKTSPPSSPEESGSLESRIRKPSGNLTRIAACIYGRGGVGKTTLLHTMPGKGLVVDIPQIEGGTHVLSEWEDKIDIIQITRWEQFEELFATILRPNKREYKWVALDSLTGAQNLAKRKTVKERPLDHDPAVLTQQDWGKVGNLMEEIVFQFRLLRMHVIFTAQERRRGDVEGGDRITQPDVSPAALSSLIPPMYLVGRLYTEEVIGQDQPKRLLRVGTHPEYVTKARALPSRPVPPIIDDPDLGQIFAYLLGASSTPPKAYDETAFTVLAEE